MYAFEGNIKFYRKDKLVSTHKFLTEPCVSAQDKYYARQEYFHLAFGKELIFTSWIEIPLTYCKVVFEITDAQDVPSEIGSGEYILLCQSCVTSDAFPIITKGKIEMIKEHFLFPVGIKHFHQKQELSLFAYGKFKEKMKIVHILKKATENLATLTDLSYGLEPVDEHKYIYTNPLNSSNFKNELAVLEQQLLQLQNYVDIVKKIVNNH